MTLIIDPQSASFSENLQQLEAFLDSRPDSAKWKDFFSSQTGQTMKEMVAGLATFTQYNTIAARREAFITFAQNRASLIGAGQALGYSSFRGRNATLKINVTPNTTGILQKFTIIGSVKDLDLIMLNDTVINSGVAVDLDVVVGSLKNQSLTVATENPASFRFNENKVSEDVRVFLNASLVEISTRILDLIEEKFVVQSNPFGSVDLKYLNLTSFTTRYSTGDILKLEWVELNDLQFTTNDLSFNFGVLNSSETIELFKAIEEKESIRINAPLFNESQFIVRGRDDFLKILLQLDTTIIDTNGRDPSPAIVDLTYVRSDLSIFTAAEKTSLISQLNRPFGVQPPTFTDPRIYFLDLSIITTLIASETGDPVVSARSIISTDIEGKLEHQIDFKTLEQSLEALDFIKITRIEIKSQVRADDTFYLLGDAIIPVTPVEPCGDLVFLANRKIYRSAITEPTFPAILDQTVIDSQIVWKTIDIDLSIPTPSDWASATDYVLGAIVKPTTPDGFHYTVDNFINKSGSSNEQQTVNFDVEPLSGTYRFEFDGEETTDLAFNSNNSVLQTALRLLTGLGGVIVTGVHSSPTLGFVVDFVGISGNEDHPEFTFGSTGIDEVRCLSTDLVPLSGNWQIDFDSQVTSVLTATSTAGQIQSALEALSNIGVGNVSVAGNFSSQFLITFIGTLAKQNITETLTVINNTTITGTSVAVTPSTEIEGVAPDAGQDEIQTLAFSQIPDGGSWSLDFEGDTTNLLTPVITNSELQTELEGLSSILAGNILVTGNFTTGFVLQYTNAEGLQDQPAIVVASNSLFRSQTTNVSVTTVQIGGGGFNEVQRFDFDITPDIGQWKITFTGQETSLLEFSATSNVIEDALEALAAIGVGNVEVTGDFSAGFLITFIGALANTDVAEMTISFNTLAKKQTVNINVIETTKGRVVDAGTDEQQKVVFDFVPDSGNWQIDFNAEQTSVLTSSSTNTDVQNALNALTGLSAVVVTGDFTSGFVIDFSGADGLQDQPEITIINNTLFSNSASVTFSSCTSLEVEGKVPANNLDAGGPVVITVGTGADGADAEPVWPGAAPCP